MFKNDFMWGAASSAYQVEGAAYQDGRGKSIWDVFCEDGKAYNKHTGAVACDHYHRFKEDIAIMKKLKIKAYRFSVSWPRIIPDGVGKVNQKGIDFYNELIDELLKNDIVPFMTLYHWDLPLELHYKGGWMNSESPEWFLNYTKVIMNNFGDRVKYFFTFNEPTCFIGLGYSAGVHAPGYKQSVSDVVRMSHHVLKAHGLAVKAIREMSKCDAKVGFAPAVGYVPFPHDENNAENIEVARQKFFDVNTSSSTWTGNVSWWCDAVFMGKYPEKALSVYEKYLPYGWEDDMKIISQPLDFIGQNVYRGREIQEDGNIIDEYPGYPRMTYNSWGISPKVIKWSSKFLYERYKLPIYITENGMSSLDLISLDGQVHDPNRIYFLDSFIAAMHEAVSDGVEINGYFYWSIMDNFEWRDGYKERYGLVYVDYRTQERIIKDSGYRYKSIIENNGIDK